MTYTLDIVVIVLSIAAAAFFAGAETALTAASRARMHALETAGDKRAKLVTRLIGARGRLISSMLLGGQFVTIGSSAIATSVLLEALRRARRVGRDCNHDRADRRFRRGDA